MSDKDETQRLLDARHAVYGDRIENSVRIAQMWSGFLGFEIQPWQVPVMQAINKMYRMNGAPDYSDNIDDVDGWMRMAREVIGDDMVKARTVEEYATGVAERDRLKAEAKELQTLRDQVDELSEGSVPVEIEGVPLTRYEREKREAALIQARKNLAAMEEYSSGRSKSNNVPLAKHPYEVAQRLADDADEREAGEQAERAERLAYLNSQPSARLSAVEMEEREELRSAAVRNEF